MAGPSIYGRPADRRSEIAGQGFQRRWRAYCHPGWSLPQRTLDSYRGCRRNLPHSDFAGRAPPGLYQLEVSVIRQDDTLPNGYTNLPVFDGDTPVGDNLYPATVRLLDPAHGTQPQHPISAQIGDSINLTGYTLDPISSLQSPISLALFWKSTAKIPTDLTVFTQLIGPKGQVWAQWDNPPQAGRYPTSAWDENDTVVDRYTLTLREGAPVGTYRLLVGMYDPSSGERLPATLNGQPQPDNAIELTMIELAQ